ncbi:MAG: hypothetical protein E4G96_07050 [Chrysiogenales bacterium]|nr:MAG: hypothetical protein E4G96_07050 [Chrysiogenales bacterium]
MKKTASILITAAMLSVAALTPPIAFRFSHLHAESTPGETVPMQEPATPAAATDDRSTLSKKLAVTAISKKSVMIGIGSIASYTNGGGETHPGFEMAGINPLTLLSFSYFFIDGLAIGILGTHQYLKTNINYKPSFLPFSISTSVTAMGGAVGLSGHYFFHATPALFPYVGIFLQYGMAGGNVPNLGSYRFSLIIVGALAGLTYMIAVNFGICIEASHIRDILDPGKTNRHGHLTSIGLGFRIFI